MNNMPNVEELKHLPQRTNFYISFKSLCTWGFSILFTLMIIGGGLSSMVVNERKDVAKEDIQRRVEILAQSKADIIHTWLSGLATKGNNLATSDALKLFMTETATRADLTNLPRALKAQSTYFKTALQDYVTRSKLTRATLLNLNGLIIVDAGDQKLLSDAQLQAFAQVLSNKKTMYAPLSVKQGVLVLDIFQPVFDLASQDERKVSGVLMSSAHVTNDLLNFLGEGPLSLTGERTSFMQQREGVLEMVEITGSSSHTYGIKNNLLADVLAGKRTQSEFSAFVSPIDQTYVYGASSYVVGTPFSILQEFDEDFAMSSVHSFARSMYTMMFLAMLIVASMFFAVVAYLIGARNRHRVAHQEQMINALVRAVEIRDPYLRGHHERIARMALDVSNKMRLNVAERGTVYYAAMLSGVGKIFVPQKIMLKPATLTGKEQAIMQEHVSHAMKVFKGIEFDFPIAEVIGEMHERMDGSGYPHGKVGTHINLLSRLVAACDVYCALTKPRSYRSELTPEQAILHMRDASSGLDKGVVGVLATVVLHEK